MTPLVDIHCHLLAGLDDGPASLEEAVSMCRIAWEEGIRVLAATAHMGERWPEVTPARIRLETDRLAGQLRAIGVPLSLYPSAEIAVRPDLEEACARKEVISIADRGTYVLIEIPAGLTLDLRGVIRRLMRVGVRPILAHPERQGDLLYVPGAIESLVRLGCLMQLSSGSITHPACASDLRILKRWVQRGLAHFVGTDGHSPRSRAPRMLAAYRQIASWAGAATADRLCSLHSLTVLGGRPLRMPEPESPRRWFAFFR